MLKITKIEIKDFGRHKYITQETDGNIVGLTGPNGSGKSTVLQAIQYAITGTIDHEDSLGSFIRVDATDKSPKNAQVSVWFTADGKPGKITRKITASATSRELEWDGKKLSADKAVAAALFEILGVDKKAVNSTVFIRQGEIGRMFGADLDRRDFYTRLLMLGSLAKVADVVDVYRKQVSDSVQDLSQARDGAQRAYDTAVEFRAQCDEELTLHAPRTEALHAVSSLVALFDVHTQAETAVANAETTRAGLGDAGELAMMSAALLAAIASDEERMTELEKLYSTHNENELRMATLRRNLQDTSELRRLWQESNTAVAEAEAASARVDELRTLPERITAAQQVVAMREREAALPGEIATLTEQVEKDEARLVIGSAKADELRAALNAKSEELRQIQADLPVRKQLRSASSGQAVCPCCGSENPDHAFLDRLIADLESRLGTVFLKVQELQKEADPYEAGVIKVRNEIVRLKASLEEKTTELTRVRIILAGADELPAATAQLAKLTQLNDERAAASADLVRLTGVMQKLSREIAGRENPSDVMVGDWERELGVCELVAARGLWTTENATELEAIKTRLPISRSRLRSMEHADQTLTAARSALSDAELKLQAGLQAAVEFPHLREHLVGKQVTTADVHAAAAALSQQQSEHDAARGKLEGARRSVAAADAALQEIDNKIAAQEERRKLVADLVLLRDTFKPNGATMEYLDYEFGRIAVLASDYLAESGADFMVSASEDVPLAFEFLRLDKPDEVWLPQTRMSGGQKVRLAVATLRAIHALIMPNVGLMVLDEPTTHLDDAAKEAMADMLRRIGSENTLQVIVCDHDPILVGAFTDQIKIPA